MKKMLYVVPFLLLLLSCEWDTNNQQSNTTDSPPVTNQPKSLVGKTDWVCIPGKKVGAITPNSTEKKLVELFGAENVKREQLSMGEGEVVQGTIIYPGSPNQLIIEWLPGQLYQKAAIVRIEGEGAEWITSQGVKIGSTMDELLEINGQPISFFGFEWDYSGLLDSWNDGKINENLIVFFAPGNPDAVYPDLMGSETFSSDDPKAKAAELYVISMMIPLNEEEIPE